MLGNAYFFGQQDYENARGELQKAVDVDPNFSPAYNMLGYAQRSLGNYPEAEGAFKKALSIDAHFLGSHFGIASALIFQGKHDQALAEAQKMERAARNGGDRRFAMFTRTLAYVDQGKTDRALGEMQKQYQLGAKAGDTAAMAGDLVQMGDILLNAGKADEAGKRYQQALDLQEKSSLSSEVKEDARLAHRYETGRVALKKNDLAKAKSEAAAYLAGATAKQNPGRITQAHALAGGIALKEKNFDQAITHLEQANQQDPYVLYKLGLAYEGTGDAGRAAEMFKQAAESYTLPTLNYVFIRAKAKEKAAPRATS